jgi:hypothetical protein
MKSPVLLSLALKIREIILDSHAATTVESKWLA